MSHFYFNYCGLFSKKNLTSLIESFSICDYLNFISHGANGYLSKTGGCIPLLARQQRVNIRLPLRDIFLKGAN